MKKILAIVALVLGSLTMIQAQEATVVDQVVGVVGKHIVKLSDVENAYLQIRVRRGYDHPFENRCELLEGMLVNKLLIYKGELDSVEVTDEEVKAQADYYMKNIERQYGSKEALRMATGYSYDELYTVYFDMLHDRILSQRVEYSLTENVKVTPAEVGEYFNKIPTDSLPQMPEEYELSEITINPIVSEEERDMVRERLAQLRERVLKGESFAMLATLYSEDPGSAKNGGELGFFSRGDMVSAFEAAAYALKPGEVSPIVETPFGFHIIQLIERKGNKLNARHILLTPKVSSDDMLKARMLLDSVGNEIRRGNISFADAAIKFSDGPSKKQGGIVSNPYTGNNRFTKEMTKQLYPGISFSAMQEGDISNAMAMTTQENKDVYRLMQLTKKVPAHKANLTDDYDKIFNAALEEAKHKKVMEWSAKMIEHTYVRIAPEFQECDFELPWIKKKSK